VNPKLKNQKDNLKYGFTECLQERPIEFHFEGLKNEDNIYAQFDNDERILLSKITIDDNNNWRLTCCENIMNKSFKIYKNDENKNSQSYVFVDYFINKTQPKFRDTLGRGVSNQTVLNGLKVESTIQNSNVFSGELITDPIVGNYNINIDRFVNFLTCKGAISLAEFKDAFIWFYGKEIINPNLFARSYNLFDQLGYFDYNYNVKERSHSIIMNPPTLVNLSTIKPRNLSNGLLGQNRALLTGSRTPELIQRIIKFCHENNNYHIHFIDDDNSFKRYLLPQTITIISNECGQDTLIKDLAEEFKLEYQENINYPMGILDYSVSLNNDFLKLLCNEKIEFHECERERRYLDYKELLGKYTEAQSTFNEKIVERKNRKIGNLLIQQRLNMDNREISRLISDFFSSVDIKTITDKKILSIENLPTMVEYDPQDNIYRKRVLWVSENNKMVAYEIDKAWGSHFMAKEKNINIIKYDDILKKLFVPFEYPLPRIIARALTMYNAVIPEEEWIKGKVYLKYTVGEGIISKLKDKLNIEIPNI